jgi:hypothetical protein
MHELTCSICQTVVGYSSRPKDADMVIYCEDHLVEDPHEPDDDSEDEDEEEEE